MAVAALQFTEDNNHKFAFTRANLRDVLRPYAKSDEVFYADDAKQQPFAFNSNLTGVDLDKIATPSATVLFYQGSGGSLDFVHQGYGLVCFVDGHAALMTTEEAASLRWAP